MTRSELHALEALSGRAVEALRREGLPVLEVSVDEYLVLDRWGKATLFRHRPGASLEWFGGCKVEVVVS